MIHTKLHDFDMTTEANDADLAFFTPAVKPMLHRLGSPEDLSRTEGGSVKTQLGPSETALIAGQDSFYVAAIGEDRWPYTQRHRGPKGLLCVLDATLLGFASLAGSRRYISSGNAVLFLLDHTLQARLKIWADAEVSEDPALIEKLAKSRGHTPATHLAFLFHVRAFGWNSEKHTAQRFAREVSAQGTLLP
jgi:predicted pyridoxine 5'-phosphate oxidase superfamily flavin-nucleotide-binding protein